MQTRKMALQAYVDTSSAIFAVRGFIDSLTPEGTALRAFMALFSEN